MSPLGVYSVKNNEEETSIKVGLDGKIHFQNVYID